MGEAQNYQDILDRADAAGRNAMGHVSPTDRLSEDSGVNYMHLMIAVPVELPFSQWLLDNAPSRGIAASRHGEYVLISTPQKSFKSRLRYISAFTNVLLEHRITCQTLVPEQQAA